MFAGTLPRHYPGKYVMMAATLFFAVLLWRSCRFVFRAIKNERNNAAQGVFVSPPDRKHSIGAAIFVAATAAFLLVSAIVDLVKAWPN